MARLLSGRSSELLSSPQYRGSMPSTNWFGSKPGFETSASTSALAEGLLRHLLQAHVERESHVVAGLRRRARERADAASRGVDLHLLESRRAVQLLFVACLDAALADEVAAAIVRV